MWCFTSTRNLILISIISIILPISIYGFSLETSSVNCPQCPVIILPPNHNNGKESEEGRAQISQPIYITAFNQRLGVPTRSDKTHHNQILKRMGILGWDLNAPVKPNYIPVSSSTNSKGLRRKKQDKEEHDLPSQFRSESTFNFGDETQRLSRNENSSPENQGRTDNEEPSEEDQERKSGSGEENESEESVEDETETEGVEIDGKSDQEENETADDPEDPELNSEELDEIIEEALKDEEDNPSDSGRDDSPDSDSSEDDSWELEFDNDPNLNQ